MNTPPTDQPHDDAAGWVVKPSPTLIAVVIVLSALALLAAWANGLPLIIRLSLMMLVLAYGWFVVKSLLYPRHRRIALEGHELVVKDAFGHARNLGLVERAFVSPLFIGLSARRPGRRGLTTLGIFRGQLDESAYRRLAAWLRSREGR